MQSAMSPGKEPTSSGTVTLEAIEGLLDKKFTPMNESIKEIQSKMSEFKSEVKSEMDQVKSKLAKTDDAVKLLGIRLKEIEKQFEEEVKHADAPMDPAILQKISDIEQSIDEMKPKATQPKSNCVAVMSGLAGAGSLEEAEKWMRKHLSDW